MYSSSRFLEINPNVDVSLFVTRAPLPGRFPSGGHIQLQTCPLKAVCSNVLTDPPFETDALSTFLASGTDSRE